MVCDADVLTQIGISKFDHFVDRSAFLDIQADTLFGKSVIMLCGNRWRAMRSTLTPAFTGNKLRHMFECFVGEQVQHLAKSMIMRCSSQQSGSYRCDALKFFQEFSVDIGASVSFGLDVESVANSKNEFHEYAESSRYFSGLKSGLRMMLLGMFPRLMEAIDFQLAPQCVRTFFKSTLMDTMNERTSKQIVRPDIVNTLMEIRNERLKRHRENPQMRATESDWTDDELVAQCFVSFYVAADSVASLLAYMAYELALNQNAQEKLFHEIRAINDSLDDGKLTYHAISKLKYMDQVINETLRKWPTALLTTRKCTKDTELDLGDGRTVSIERGTCFWIPISAIHNDPKNFPDPEKFDPDRFNEENKLNIKSGSFIPFGIGPRSCLGEYINSEKLRWHNSFMWCP